MASIFGRSDGEAASGPNLSVTGIHRILVCHVSHTLGNTLLLTPLLAEIESTYPGAEVHIVTRSPVARVIFSGFFSVRRIFRSPSHGFASPVGLWSVMRKLRSTRYDLAIDPCLRSQSDRLGVVWARATHTLGFASEIEAGRLGRDVSGPKSLRPVGFLPVYLLRTAGRYQFTPLPAAMMPEPSLGAPELVELVSLWSATRVLAQNASTRYVLRWAQLRPPDGGYALQSQSVQTAAVSVAGMSAVA